MDWIEVSITTKSEAVDAISNFLQEMGVLVSIQDPKDLLFTEQDDISDIIIDKELFQSENVIIKTYFLEQTDIDEKINIISEYLKSISKYVDTGSPNIQTNKVREQDWSNSWKQYYKPIKIGKKVVVKPLWEEYYPSDGDVVVELDPGMAFGTGTHETTSMCIKFLEKYICKEMNILDVGCGSGILGICASKLGAKEVVAVDIDPVAVKIAKENALVNNIQNLKVRQGNLFDVVNGKYDIVVSNIIADIIINMTNSIGNYLVQNGLFISSGIIKDRYNDVKNELIKNGYKIIDEMHDGEWVAIVSKLE